MAIDMDRASKSGKMVVSTPVTGNKTKPTVKEDSFTLTEMSMKVNGTMIKHKVEEPTNTWMAPSTSETGKKIDSTAMESNLGQIKQSTKVITNMERNTA